MERMPLPLWAKLLIVADCLPVLTFPALLAACPPEQSVEILVWIYPFAVTGAGVLAWLSWWQRRELAWILLAVALLMHFAVWGLVALA